MSIVVNKKAYNKQEVRDFFRASRAKIREHNIDDRKEPLNSIMKAVEKFVHIAAIADEIYNEDEKVD